jgi:hypothetical protein
VIRLALRRGVAYNQPAIFDPDAGVPAPGAGAVVALFFARMCHEARSHEIDSC